MKKKLKIGFIVNEKSLQDGVKYKKYKHMLKITFEKILDTFL